MAAYQPAGPNGGHSFNRVSADTFEVTYQSNAAPMTPQLRDFCLLRAAEVAKEYGYDYFTVEGELHGSQTRSMRTINSTTITTQTPAPKDSGSSDGSSGTSSTKKPKPTETTTTVSTMGNEDYYLPNITLRIRCYTSYPTGPHTGVVFEAVKTRDELAAKYEIVLY